jgi:hypothetical protein
VQNNTEEPRRESARSTQEDTNSGSSDMAGRWGGGLRMEVVGDVVVWVGCSVEGGGIRAKPPPSRTAELFKLDLIIWEMVGNYGSGRASDCKKLQCGTVATGLHPD